MKELSQKFGRIAPSMTLAITAKAKQLKAEGHDIVSFGAGEPDFNTPEFIRKVAIDRINIGGIGYTDASGMPDLKKAVCEKLLKDNRLTYEPKQIVCSNGAKHSLSNAILAVSNPGDEILVPSPFWVSYEELVKMAGAVPVIVDSDPAKQFKVTPCALRAAITPKTKAIILNSPNNPTGSVYTKDELKAIGEVCTEADLYIISDEIYEKLVYGVEHVSIASLSDDLYRRTIVINGLSKAYAMTGWRLGYSASSPEIAKMMSNIQSHETSNPNTISQYAAVEALRGDQTPIEEMRVQFDQRRLFMMKKLDEIQGITYVKPDGAFYIMVDVSGTYGAHTGFNGSIDFAAKLLEDEKVAVVPGIAFGVDKYIRLSYATSIELIDKGLTRIKKFIESLPEK